MDSIFYLGVLLLLGSIAGWFVGELLGKAWLRLVCGLVVLPLVAVVPYTYGRVSGTLDANIRCSGATAGYIQALADEIEAGDEMWVRDEIVRMSGEINTTKEAGAFIEAMEEATRRVRGED